MQVKTGLVLWLAATVACSEDGEDGMSGEDATSAAGSSSADDGTAGADGSGDEGDPGAIDVDAIMAEAEGYAAYTKVNAESRASQHALGETVNYWVAADTLDAYLAVDPAATADSASFAAGTYLFKEHLDAEGGFNGLTIMFKAAAGYNPEAGDWWWGRTDKDFAILDQGKVAFCIACHTPVAESDYVWGVPLDNRQ